jgi:predicted LPLAT superfamily acyltransferase
MSSDWEGKSKGSPLGYKIFVYTLKLLGVGFAYFLLRFVSLYYLFFSWKSNKPLRFYYKDILSFSSLYTWWLVYKNYYNFGQTLLDKTAVMAGINASFTFDFENEYYLREMAEQGKGGILISAHIGNWEIAGHLLERIQQKINIVMYDAEHEKIKEVLSNVVKEKNFNIIVVNESNFSHIYEISDALARNEIICIHGDRFVEGSKSLIKPFLGRPAEFPIGPYFLAVQYEVPVYFVYAMKDSSTHYHLYAYPPKSGWNEGKTKRQKAEILLEEYIFNLEKMLLKYPTQWYNFYKFWK